MTNFNFPISNIRETRIANTAGAAAAASGAFRSVEDTVFVDVGSRVIDANVVRDGVKVGVFELDPDILDDVIVGRPIITQRVIRQSVAPGTPVAVGTAINLVVAQTGGLPTGVITGVLTELTDTPLAEVYRDFVAGNDAVTRILARVGPDNTLPAAETEQLRAVFGAQRIELTDEPGKDLSAAIETLRAARTFGA